MKYEVWGTQGQGGMKIAEFKTAYEAGEFVGKHKGKMSFAIKVTNQGEVIDHQCRCELGDDNADAS